ncbi:MAG: YIP1 family protein [Candidatus Stahlbacteria bacterium]|nr:YIP1 family protein [Candidatus Stahlbacteria bacterium]
MNKNLLRIFYSPMEVFKDIGEKPAWIWAFFVLLVISLAFTAGLVPTVIRPEAIEKMQEAMSTGASSEHLTQAMKFITGTRFYIISLLGVCFSTAISILFQAGIFLCLLLLLAKQISFKHLLSLTVYTKLVTLPGLVLKFPLALAKKSIDVHTDLLLFTPFVKPETFIYRFLANFDFFMLWSLLLFAVGISEITKLDRKKSYFIVFLLWGIFIIITSLLGGLGEKWGG